MASGTSHLHLLIYKCSAEVQNKILIILIYNVFSEALKLQINKLETSTRAKNCDDVYNAGFHTNGIFNLSTNKSSFQAFCEFQRDSYNWMVRFGKLTYKRQTNIHNFLKPRLQNFCLHTITVVLTN